MQGILRLGLAAIFVAAGVLHLLRPRPFVGRGLAALLVAVFPANIDMLLHRERSGTPLSTWLLVARLPLQPALIAAVLLASRRP